jgi:hypothetical protein
LQTVSSFYVQGVSGLTEVLTERITLLSILPDETLLRI